MVFKANYGEEILLPAGSWSLLVAAKSPFCSGKLASLNGQWVFRWDGIISIIRPDGCELLPEVLKLS